MADNRLFHLFRMRLGVLATPLAAGVGERTAFTSP